MSLAEHLRSLCALSGPPGYEHAVVGHVRKHLQSLGLDARQDRTGQLSVVIGTGTGEPTLITAHLDEVALVVHRVEEDGFLRIRRVGGVPERLLPGSRFNVLTRHGPIPAVVGSLAHHLTPETEKYVAHPAEDLYLDIGARTRSEALHIGARVGDMACTERCFTELPNGGVVSPALDDRSGVASLCELAERLAAAPPERPVILGFTTQEEFHVRGTLSLVAHHHPAAVVNVDVSPATDTPDLDGTGNVALGAGPVLNRLSFHGRGTLGGLIPHQGLADAVETAATDTGTPLQLETIIGLITDAAFVPMSTAEGVATVGIGIPCRYTHSSVEQIRMDDLIGCTDILESLAHSLDTSTLTW
ncbi:hypothetical protein AXK56_04125 [Tsukamurella pulmonis]|uniref:Putative aminopeptidase FrvX n=1 Tax=Tsukamurella pulmonis TaxID=47312 RepID=A0A1H1DMR4_9ACTN|nr:M20/M25/M40 family metallo-hydrolase [Tsukamurella pulmonis]KXO92273.1 hypothetical protein AXK56_04125 [Tsukamurella pulmonis]SDQ77727.1 Putative aminopeptidase FrvX [Tsukamurella pulmonis]SUP21897.1 Putative aminopeptidase ysdC [Tsukamurella pulmonis]